MLKSTQIIIYFLTLSTIGLSQSDPLALFRCNEGVGDTIYSSNESHFASLHNTVEWNNGKRYTALEFSGFDCAKS